MLEKTLSLEKKIGEILSKSNTTLSAAESCTGGMISHVITSVPGASKYYLGSVTSYAIRIKEKVLGVPAEVIRSKGVVSSEVACAMAEGVKNLMQSTYAVATTGLAGPGGDEFNPQGTVWIAVSGPQGTVSHKHIMNGERKENIELFTHAAIEMLYDYIRESIGG